MRRPTAMGLVIVVLALGGGYAWALTPDPVDAATGGLSSAASLLPMVPCATEDSHDCYWNPRVQGNGEGRSFVDIGGIVYFLD